jgi:hypothetical protein
MDTTAHNFRPLNHLEAKLFNLRYSRHMQAINKAHPRWATHHIARKSLIQLLINKELQVDTGRSVGLDIPISHRMVVRPASILESGEVPYNIYQAGVLELDGTSSKNKVSCLGTGQDRDLRLLGWRSGISILLTTNTETR